MGNSEDVIQLAFQWVVGDMRPLEKSLLEILKSDYDYLIDVFSRLVAFGLTFVASALLLPSVDVWKVFLIALAGSYSVWVSWSLSILAFRRLEKMRAQDSTCVGWNNVEINRNGIVWSTDTSQEYTSWLGISDVIEMDGSVWLKTGDAQGYYLPPRAFETERDLAECLQLIKTFRREATAPIHFGGEFNNPVTKH